MQEILLRATLGAGQFAGRFQDLGALRGCECPSFLGGLDHTLNDDLSRVATLLRTFRGRGRPVRAVFWKAWCFPAARVHSVRFVSNQTFKLVTLGASAVKQQS